MLESLKKVGQEVGEGMGRAWSSLAEGWRELWQRSGGALTRFRRDAKDEEEAAAGRALAPRWAMLAGDVYENDREIVVRLEAPGLDKDNFRISVEDTLLRISGEKRYEREEESARHYLRERAYGYFERVLPLPQDVDAAKAKASYNNGVLTVRLPKTRAARASRITIH